MDHHHCRHIFQDEDDHTRLDHPNIGIGKKAATSFDLGYTIIDDHGLSNRGKKMFDHMSRDTLKYSLPVITLILLMIAAFSNHWFVQSGKPSSAAHMTLNYGLESLRFRYRHDDKRFTSEIDLEESVERVSKIALYSLLAAALSILILLIYVLRPVIKKRRRGHRVVFLLLAECLLIFVAIMYPIFLPDALERDLPSDDNWISSNIQKRLERELLFESGDGDGGEEGINNALVRGDTSDTMIENEESPPDSRSGEEGDEELKEKMVGEDITESSGDLRAPGYITQLIRGGSLGWSYYLMLVSLVLLTVHTIWFIVEWKREHEKAKRGVTSQQ